MTPSSMCPWPICTLIARLYPAGEDDQRGPCTALGSEALGMKAEERKPPEKVRDVAAELPHVYASPWRTQGLQLQRA